MIWGFQAWDSRPPCTEKKKAYTTNIERKSFGELFWPQRKTFQAGGGYKNPMKTGKTYIYHRNLSSVAPIFSAKKSSALEQGGVCFLLPSLQSSVSPKNTAHMLGDLTRSMRDASPQSICRAERNPGPEQ